MCYQTCLCAFISCDSILNTSIYVAPCTTHSNRKSECNLKTNHYIVHMMAGMHEVCTLLGTQTLHVWKCRTHLSECEYVLIISTLAVHATSQ